MNLSNDPRAVYNRLRLEVPQPIREDALRRSRIQTDPTEENINSVSEMYEIVLLKKPGNLLHQRLEQAFLNLKR